MEVPMTIIDTVWEPHTYPTPYLKPSTITGTPLHSNTDTHLHNLAHSVHTHLPWHQHAHGTQEVCPETDIRETAGAYIIEMALAGVSDRESVVVHWRAPRILIVSGGLAKPEAQSEREDAGKGRLAVEGEAGGLWIKGDTGEQSGGKNGEGLRKVEGGAKRDGRSGDVRVESIGLGQTNGRVEDDLGVAPLFILRERRLGVFQRTFTLPVDVDVEGCRAKLEHGLLRIDIPKMQPQEKLEERLMLDDT